MIPLWLIWTAVVLLAVRPVLELIDWFPRRREEGVLPPGTTWKGDHLIVPLLAAVVAAAFTLDAVRVSESELADAAERAGASLAGGAYGAALDRDRLEVAIEDRLGRDVTTTVASTSADTREDGTGTMREAAIEVRPGDDGSSTGSPVICADVVSLENDATGLWVWQVDVSEGECEEPS